MSSSKSNSLPSHSASKQQSSGCTAGLTHSQSDYVNNESASPSYAVLGCVTWMSSLWRSSFLYSTALAAATASASHAASASCSCLSFSLSAATCCLHSIRHAIRFCPQTSCTAMLHFRCIEGIAAQAKSYFAPRPGCVVAVICLWLMMS